MKNRNKILILVLGLMFATPLISKAQTLQLLELEGRRHNNQMALVYNSGGTPDTTAIFLFNQNAPARFDAPALPRFAIMGKNKKYYMGIGGYVKGTVSMDFDGAIKSGAFFSPNQIPIPSPSGDKALFQINANTTTIFYNLVSTSHRKWKFGAYLNGRFSGPSNSLVMRDAYVTFGGLKLGYTTSLFTDGASIPTTIDTEGPCAATFKSNSVVQYTQAFGTHFSVALGAEMPIVDMTVTDNVQAEIYQKIPDVPIYVQYAWGHNNESHVRVSGLMRNMQYRNLLEAENKTVTSFAGQISGLATFLEDFTVFAQMAYGAGLGTYIQDISGLGLAFLPDWNSEENDYRGKMVATDAAGGFIGLQYQLNPFITFSANYSMDWIDLPKNYTDPQAYYEGQYVAGNVIWCPIHNVELGFEYLWGQRENSNGDNNSANRVQVMAKFNF